MLELEQLLGLIAMEIEACVEPQKAGLSTPISPSSDRVVQLNLADLRPTAVRVAYGQLGLNGDLGYEGKRIAVQNNAYAHAISAHGPSEVSFELKGKYTEFRSLVAINDDSDSHLANADFLVVADGRVVGVARNVKPCQTPRLIQADVQNVSSLRIVVTAHGFPYCHSVWLDPVLLQDGERNRVVGDSLGRVRIEIPDEPLETQLCIATVGSAGCEEWIDGLLGSVRKNAQCPRATLAVFSVGDSAPVRLIARKHGAIVIPCWPERDVNFAVKSLLYSAGLAIRSEKFICLDADMLVLDNLQPIVAAIDAAPPGSIFTCRQGVWAPNLGDAINEMYGSDTADIAMLLGESDNAIVQYPFIVSDSVFAGTRAALNALDSQIRTMNAAAEWIDDPQISAPWRNQFIFNLAIAQSQSGVELDSRFNIELQSRDIDFGGSALDPVLCDGRRAAILRFNGASRHSHREWREYFLASLPQP